jgi:hypothetical protein
MNQQKGVQTAAEIAARGLIGKKKTTRPNRRQANAQWSPPVPTAQGGRAGKRPTQRASRPAKRYPIDYPASLDELLSGSISYANYLI